jgi:hypothetical protein
LLFASFALEKRLDFSRDFAGNRAFSFQGESWVISKYCRSAMAFIAPFLNPPMHGDVRLGHSPAEMSLRLMPLAKNVALSPVEA